MNRRPPSWPGLFLALLSLAASADANPIEIEVGFAGRFKVGCWTPVRVRFPDAKRPEGECVLVTEDGDGMPVRYPLVNGAGCFRAGRVSSRLRLEDERGQTLKTFTPPTAVSATQKLFVTLGPDEAVSESLRVLNRSEDEPLVAAAVKPAEMPTHWQAFEGVQAVYVNVRVPDLLSSLSDEQFAAIDQWVRLGGKLVLAAGEAAPQTFADDAPRAARSQRLLPGKFKGVISSNRSLGLENFVGASERLDVSRGMPICVLEEPRGAVEVREGFGGADDHPLLIRTPHGLGQIVFLAVDPEQPPLTTWSERPRLLARILREGSSKRSDEEEEGTGRVQHFGYRDIVGQLRGSLDQFRGMQGVSFSLVAVIVLGYVVLLGPGQYVLINRVLRRPGWMWPVSLALIVGVCGLTYALAQRHRGDRLLINQVAVTDVDVVTGTVRGTVWAHLFSPRSESFSLRVEPTMAVRDSQSLLAWQGLPGNGLGGLSSQSAAPFLAAPYTLNGGSATELPISTGATKSLLGRWWGELPDRNAGELRTSFGGGLQGQVRNPLTVEVREPVVIHGQTMYRFPRSLEPGESLSMEVARPQNLEWQLQRRNILDGRDKSTPWDPTSIDDLPRLMEVMMFFDAAGGRAYTRLSNGYQTWLDLSPQLRMGQAVLVGRLAAPPSDWRRDGEPLTEFVDQEWSWVRVLIPVGS